MNLERIERLKGLLTRIDRNSKKARQPLPPQQASATPARVPTLSGVTSMPPVSLEPDEFELSVSVSPPPAAAKRPISVAPISLPQASTEKVSAQAAPVSAQPLDIDIEDVSADELGLEDVSFEDIAVEAPAPAPAPVQTAVQASPAPFTALPALDDLTFSIPPPAEEPAAASAPPPVSSRQVISEAPDSIDAALMAASEAQGELEAELEEAEAPLLTPPPESGRQPARPSAAGLAAEVASYRQSAPTIEQLGEVVELEEARGPVLELATPATKAVKPELEELEFVPQASTREPLATLVGETLEELPPSSRRQSPPARFITAPPPARVETPEAEAFEEEAPTATAALTAEVTSRRAVSVLPSRPVIDVVSQAQSFRPRSFLELLDASLKLGKK